MNEIWGSWFYRRPTNPPNLKKALREWLGGSYSIENDAHKQPQWQQFSIKIVNLKIPWGLWFYRCIFRKRVGISRIITIKLLTPTLSLNSKGDSLSTSWASFARSVMQLEPATKIVVIPKSSLQFLMNMWGDTALLNSSNSVEAVLHVQTFQSQDLWNSVRYLPMAPGVSIFSGSNVLVPILWREQWGILIWNLRRWQARPLDTS